MFCRMGGVSEKLEDVVADRSFLYVSKVDIVCDQVGGQKITADGVESSV